MYSVSAKEENDFDLNKKDVATVSQKKECENFMFI